MPSPDPSPSDADRERASLLCSDITADMRTMGVNTTALYDAGLKSL